MMSEVVIPLHRHFFRTHRRLADSGGISGQTSKVVCSLAEDLQVAAFIYFSHSGVFRHVGRPAESALAILPYAYSLLAKAVPV